jgi:hypothetical protein
MQRIRSFGARPTAEPRESRLLIPTLARPAVVAGGPARGDRLERDARGVPDREVGHPRRHAPRRHAPTPEHARTTLLDKWIVPYPVDGRRTRSVDAELGGVAVDRFAADLPQALASEGPRRPPGRLPSGGRVAPASPGTPSSASAASRTPAPRRSTPEPRRPSRRSARGSTRRTQRLSASSPTRASARPRRTRSSGAT